MAYIAPNSTIQLMSGVPLEASYQNTLYWDRTNTSAQDTYFATKVLRSFTAQSYARASRNTIKLMVDMDDVVGTANYMRFKNTSFENKWFYAFITNMEYVSNNVTAITYQIDVMQTWWYDFTNNPCFVEREHSSTDQVGDNLIPESLETGPYCIAGSEEIFNPTFGAWIAVSSSDYNGNVSATRFDNQFTGLTLYNGNGITELNDLFDAFKNGPLGSLESIISIQQYPTGFVNNQATATLSHGSDIGQGPFRALYPRDGLTHRYRPWNNKLYTYPYNYMSFQSPDGSSNELRYELFANLNTFSFTELLGRYPEVEIMCMPDNYDNFAHDIHQALYCKNYPICGIASDAYSAWWAQNKTVLTSDAITSTTSDVFSALGVPAISSGNIPGAPQAYADTINTIKQIFSGNKGYKETTPESLLNWLADTQNDTFNILAQKQHYKAVPDTVVTKAGCAGVMTANGLSDFIIAYVKIHPQYAEMIDMYFNAYGYAANIFKTPNYSARPHWNYIKTKGCTLTGNIPAGYEKEICSIFDNGITIWKTPSEVGNYSLDNRPSDTHGTVTCGWLTPS